MLPALSDSWWRSDQTHDARIPDSRPCNSTQERGTRCAADAGKINGLGHPPSRKGSQWRFNSHSVHCYAMPITNGQQENVDMGS